MQHKGQFTHYEECYSVYENSGIKSYVALEEICQVYENNP